MQYSTKMKIGHYLALIMVIIFVLIGGIIFSSFDLEALSPDSLMNLLAVFLLFLGAIVTAMISSIFLEYAIKHLKENSKQFRSHMNYCYSCGFSLKEATTAELCPKCNSKLHILNVIDE